MPFPPASGWYSVSIRRGRPPSWTPSKRSVTSSPRSPSPEKISRGKGRYFRSGDFRGPFRGKNRTNHVSPVLKTSPRRRFPRPPFYECTYTDFRKNSSLRQKQFEKKLAAVYISVGGRKQFVHSIWKGRSYERTQGRIFLFRSFQVSCSRFRRSFSGVRENDKSVPYVPAVPVISRSDHIRCTIDPRVGGKKRMLKKFTVIFFCFLCCRGSMAGDFFEYAEKLGAAVRLSEASVSVRTIDFLYEFFLQIL